MPAYLSISAREIIIFLCGHISTRRHAERGWDQYRFHVFELKRAKWYVFNADTENVLLLFGQEIASLR